MIYHCNVTNQPSNMTITDEGLGGMLQIFSNVVPKYQSFILARGMEMYKQFNEKVKYHQTVTRAMHFVQDLVQDKMGDGVPDPNCNIRN